MTHFFMPCLRVCCSLALLVAACGEKKSEPAADSLRADAGEMGGATPSPGDDGGQPNAGSDGGAEPLPAQSCLEANEPFDPKAATRFGKVDPEQTGLLFALGDRLFVSSSDGLLEVVQGKSDPVLVVADAPGEAHLVGKTWYFVGDTTVSRMDATTPGATPTLVRSDLVDLPYMRIVGEKAVYQQIETGIQVFPLDGSAAFMLSGVAEIDGGVEHAGLFYYFDSDAERPFRAEPVAGAVPEALSAGDDTFGDFGGAVATNGKYVVWDVGDGILKGAPIGKPSEVTVVASVPSYQSFNDGIYSLTFVGDRLYFSFDRTEDDPKGGNRTFTNIAYIEPAGAACAVVVSDLWGFDATYAFMLSENTLWVVASADGSVYTKAL